MKSRWSLVFPAWIASDIKWICKDCTTNRLYQDTPCTLRGGLLHHHMRSLFPVRSLRSRIRFHLLLCPSLCRPFHSRRVCSLRFPRLSVACLVFVPFPIPGHACTCVVCCAIYLRFYVRIFQLLYMYYFIKGFVSVSASIRVVGSPTSPVYASLQHAVSCPFVRAVCPSTGVCESALRRCHHL
jgi:hypothetical protein